MIHRIAAAPARRISADEAAGLVRSGMRVDYGNSISQPDVFDRALAARLTEIEQVKIRSCLSARPRAVLEADPEGRHVYWFSWHFTAYDRRQHDCGRCNYIPLNLGEVPDYYRRFVEPVDLAVIQVCPVDTNGNFNFGPTHLWHRAIVERSRILVLEVNPALPPVCGDNNVVHISEADYLIDGDGAPPAELPNPPPTDVDRAVARTIAAEIEDGACLQIGIGGMPNAVCALLYESSVQNLGIHTEMLTDGIAALYRAGRIDGARKTLDRGLITYTFALGSQSLYATVERNPDFYLREVEYTNMPHVILQNEHVVSINNTTQVDLQGQAASESDGHRHISGTGLFAAPTPRPAANHSFVFRPPTTSTEHGAAASCSI